MGFDARVDGCEESFSCSHGGLAKFKCEIFRGWNEELGILYEEKSRYLWDDNHTFTQNFSFMELIQLYKERENGILGQKIRKILNEYDKPFNEGMKIFYDVADCLLTPKQCKLILDAFNRVDINKFDKSDKDIHEWLIESYDIWKEMLQYAIDHNENIRCG